MAKADVQRNWDHGQVDLTATSTVYEVCKLYGGQSVTIKALQGNQGFAYIGSDKLLSTSNGFQLDATETLTLALPLTFGADNYVVIYAVTDSAGDDLCYVKLIDSEPVTFASV